MTNTNEAYEIAMSEVILGTLNAEGDEVYGALYIGPNRVTGLGWWRTEDKAEATVKAINSLKITRGVSI